MGQIDIILSGLDLFIEERIVVLATELHAEITEQTPVDTGWARANWVPSIGAAYSGGARSSATSAQVNIALSRAQQGLRELESYDLSLGDVYVSNNVPYIEALNDGWSAQAPTGFVQASIDRAIKAVT